jgi:type VI secretion system protein ImpK
MSQDDPFSTGSEKTVIRPNPGGRRAAAPQAPVAAPMNEPRRGDAPAVMPSVGNNPLASAAAPLLALAVRLRSTAALANVDTLRERVVNEIRAFERRVSSTDLPREALRGGHYAICATIDDVINNTPWGMSAQWARQSMCGIFHKDVAGGDRFFDFLGHFQREPGRYTSVLELMYLCLSLGFEGRFRVAQRGASELLRVREGLYNLLRQSRGEVEPALSPQWRGLEAPHRPLSSVLPAWVIGVAVAALLTLFYVVFSYLLSDDSDRVFGRFAALPPAGPVALYIPVAPAAPPPPPPPQPVPQHDTLLQRLTTFLAPEIKQGLVTVSTTIQTATVRIRGTDLFASGTATLNDKYLPLIGRIAAALDKEQGSILVVGHTDNVPIRSLRFPSNYQLSVARADTVRDLVRRGLTTPRDLSAEGRADSDPVASNATAEGRAANRRTEVILNRQDDGQ